jgi:hypothetical protein
MLCFLGLYPLSGCLRNYNISETGSASVSGDRKTKAKNV